MGFRKVFINFDHYFLLLYVKFHICNSIDPHKWDNDVFVD